jgi:hypothetical protein
MPTPISLITTTTPAATSPTIDKNDKSEIMMMLDDAQNQETQEGRTTLSEGTTLGNSARITINTGATPSANRSHGMPHQLQDVLDRLLAHKHQC